MERKTLGINRQGMLPPPNVKEIVRKDFLDESSGILDEFIKLSPSYDDSHRDGFRLFHETANKLAGVMNSAYNELKAKMRYPIHSRPEFEKMTREVYDELVASKGSVVEKFKDTFKQNGPPKTRVLLDSPRQP